jgi:hypothetical protein
MPDLHCARCNRTPEATHGLFAEEEGITPDEYVLTEEGTLDIESGAYLCDECYIAVGEPAYPAGSGRQWTASPENMERARLIDDTHYFTNYMCFNHRPEPHRFVGYCDDGEPPECPLCGEDSDVQLDDKTNEQFARTVWEKFKQPNQTGDTTTCQ